MYKYGLYMGCLQLPRVVRRHLSEAMSRDKVTDYRSLLVFVALSVKQLTEGNVDGHTLLVRQSHIFHIVVNGVEHLLEREVSRWAAVG